MTLKKTKTKNVPTYTWNLCRSPAMKESISEWNQLLTLQQIFRTIRKCGEFTNRQFVLTTIVPILCNERSWICFVFFLYSYDNQTLKIVIQDMEMTAKELRWKVMQVQNFKNLKCTINLLAPILPLNQAWNSWK